MRTAHHPSTRSRRPIDAARYAIAPIALAATVLLVAAAPVRAGSEPRPFIGVNGEGSVRVEPDEARIRLGVESEAPTAKQAQLEANGIGSAILKSIGALGVEPTALETSQLNLWPVYESLPTESRGQRRPRVVAYRATNVITVRLIDLTRIGPVVDAAIGAGSNRVEGLDLGLQDDSEARRAALAAAVDEARRKAETIAEALGVELGPVLEAADQGVQVPRFDMRQRAFDMATAEAATPIATGEITVSASVMLRFAISQD